MNVSAAHNINAAHGYDMTVLSITAVDNTKCAKNIYKLRLFIRNGI